MTRSRRPVAAAAGSAALLVLSGCGLTTASSTGTPSAAVLDAIRLSADQLACTTTTTTGASAAASSPSSTASAAPVTTCTVRVTYTNGSTSSLQLDATETRVLDAAGGFYKATAVGTAPRPMQIAPGTSAVYRWQVVMPVGATPASVRWTGDLGDTATAVIATASPTPSPTPTPTLTPSPTPTPTPTPTPSKTAKPTKKPSSGGGQTSRPRPSTSTPAGQIG